MASSWLNQLDINNAYEGLGWSVYRTPGIIKAINMPFSVSVVTTGAVISIFSPLADSVLVDCGAGITTGVSSQSFRPFILSEMYLNNGLKASSDFQLGPKSPGYS